MDYDDDQDFNSEEVGKIAQTAIQAVIGKDPQIEYQKEKVNQWCHNIIDNCIKDLAKLQKPFKYAVTCVIMENNGSGLQTAATSYWETKKDGLSAVQWGGPDKEISSKFSIIVNIFAVSI